MICYHPKNLAAESPFQSDGSDHNKEEEKRTLKTNLNNRAGLVVILITSFTQSCKTIRKNDTSLNLKLTKKETSLLLIVIVFHQDCHS